MVNMNATGYEITRTRDAINNVEAYFEQHPALLKQATGADQLVPAPEKAGATQPAEFHCHPSNTINALNRLKGMLTTDVEATTSCRLINVARCAALCCAFLTLSTKW